MTNSNKQLVQYKKTVQKRYPGAYAVCERNRFTIVQEQDDLSIKDILAEMLFLPTITEDDAWKLASTVSKVTQNINRTHPLRNEGMAMEEKMIRLENRRHRAELTKKKKKNIY